MHLETELIIFPGLFFLEEHFFYFFTIISTTNNSGEIDGTKGRKSTFSVEPRLFEFPRFIKLDFKFI
jgi:hypothetical protein